MRYRDREYARAIWHGDLSIVVCNTARANATSQISLIYVVLGRHFCVNLWKNNPRFSSYLYKILFDQEELKYPKKVLSKEQKNEDLL